MTIKIRMALTRVTGIAATKKSVINERVIQDSITKLDLRYLAKNNAVMFTVEVGFIVALIIALSPGISAEFVRYSQGLHLETAVILILTVWFAIFSESLSEAQARIGVDSLRNLEKEVSARKIVNDKEVVAPSKSLNHGDEVIVMQVKQFQEMALLERGKHS